MLDRFKFRIWDKENVCADTITNFYKRHTYFGKSKANIDDLFKTENEE